uniref:metal ABC transporter ATP-binding protein n=1 Tax=Eubacterium cellulosolvens TaxID=29322 RepID=UPI000488A27A|nr:ABC transporter ATP-binding protein [[Eubacterium] cellulosolvens]
MSLLTCHDLTFSYEGKNVLTGVNFTVDEGDYLAVIGENGAGKSTLMKGLLQLKKPSSGSIVYSDGVCANEIGYLPQQTLVQKDFPASVYEVVLSGCLNHLGRHFFYGKKWKNYAEEKMELLGITELRNCCYRDLSGGQQQRVLLARALCACRKMILLDEPVTGLDPCVTADLYRMIRTLHDEENMTIIMISHDVEGALREADHILHLDGRQLFFGTSAEYRVSGTGRAFLGSAQDNGGDSK